MKRSRFPPEVMCDAVAKRLTGRWRRYAICVFVPRSGPRLVEYAALHMNVRSGDAGKPELQRLERRERAVLVRSPPRK